MNSFENLNLEFYYYRSFYDNDSSKNILNNLKDNIKWTNDKFKMYGKSIILKRKIAWYAENGKSYTYSGIKKESLPLTEELSIIKSKVEKKTNLGFNSVLLNDYENGQVGMGWHSDDEKELGKNPTIASLSFGVERDMLFRNKNNPSLKVIKILIENGSLLVMKGKTQHFWQHSIPKRLKVKQRRINLTFRTIL
jgi:alkylated DNA repair dioxygenase AlkB|tara:strand:- start:101 stop:682 length:582 start_codon:yes stop_codon:yes gene_type:complete